MQKNVMHVMYVCVRTTHVCMYYMYIIYIHVLIYIYILYVCGTRTYTCMYVCVHTHMYAS